ncbi:MAG: putative glycolipid-binding domain-containing protein [Desertimonas sp.]
MSDWVPFGADGHEVAWVTPDGDAAETVTIGWDNEAWTVSGRLADSRVEYVIRLSPTWRVRQFLLFRDLPEPDLWLATDGHGRWGEINGAHRTELDGCDDLDVTGATFPVTIPIRRLPLAVGDAAELPVITVDVETLAAVTATRRYTRLGERRWRRWRSEDGDGEEFDLDDHGLVIAHPGRIVRA